MLWEISSHECLKGTVGVQFIRNGALTDFTGLLQISSISSSLYANIHIVVNGPKEQKAFTTMQESRAHTTYYDDRRSIKVKIRNIINPTFASLSRALRLR